MFRRSFFFLLIFASISLFVYGYTYLLSDHIFILFRNIYAFNPTPPEANINHPPIAQNMTITLLDTSPIVIILKGSDPDADKNNFVLVTDPVYGKIHSFDNSTGLVTYIPSSLNDVFTFKITDNKTAESNIGIVNLKFDSSK
jgi:hypothetical protein